MFKPPIIEQHFMLTGQHYCTAIVDNEIDFNDIINSGIVTVLESSSSIQQLKKYDETFICLDFTGFIKFTW